MHYDYTSHLLPARATEFTLPPAELVRGVPLRGTVVDDAGRLVSGALVRALWGDREAILQTVAARTGPRGNFLLEGLDPKADLRLTVDAQGWATAAPQPARAGDGTEAPKSSPRTATPAARRPASGPGASGRRREAIFNIGFLRKIVMDQRQRNGKRPGPAKLTVEGETTTLVPRAQPSGPLEVTIDFDSGPLARKLHAATAVNVKHDDDERQRPIGRR
jgi:hypothetical protein